MLLFKFLASCQFCPGSNFQVDTTWMMTMCAPDWTSAGRYGWCDEPTHSILWEGSEPLLLSQKGEGTNTDSSCCGVKAIGSPNYGIWRKCQDF